MPRRGEGSREGFCWNAVRRIRRGVRGGLPSAAYRLAIRAAGDKIPAETALGSCSRGLKKIQPTPGHTRVVTTTLAVLVYTSRCLGGYIVGGAEKSPK